MADKNPIHEARRHYLCALYHSVFTDRRTNTNIVCWSKKAIDGDDGVADYEAQILVRHRMALIRVGGNGVAYLTATLTGARKAGKNKSLYDHRGQLLSCVPHASEGVPIDMNAVKDACYLAAHRFTVNGLY